MPVLSTDLRPEQDMSDQAGEEVQETEGQGTEETDEVRIATELVYQMMERAPAKASKALQEIQSNLSSRKLLTELTDAAEKLVGHLHHLVSSLPLPTS